MAYDFDQLFSETPKDPAVQPVAKQGYDFDALFAEPKQETAQASMYEASFGNPDQEAQRRQVARDLETYLGDTTPPAILDLPDAQRRARVAEMDHATQGRPKTSAWLSNVDNARIAGDDVKTLANIERILDDFQFGRLSEPAPDYSWQAKKELIAGSAKAGVESLRGAVAKVFDAANPFGMSDQELAVLYKNDPEGLRKQRDSAPNFLKRIAARESDRSAATMQGLPQSGYSDLRYDTLGENSAWRAPTKIVADALQSMPSTIALAVTGLMSRGAAVAAETRALAGGATAEAARTAGIAAATKAGAVVGGVGEGVQAYAQSAASLQSELEKLPEAELLESPLYANLIDQGYSKEAARLFAAAHTAEQSGRMGGVTTGLISAAGGRYLGKIIGEGGGLFARGAKGFAAEALTEAPQSGLEQFWQNLAKQQNIDPNQDLTEDVANAALQGLAVGGATGGLIAAMAGRGESKIKAEQGADQLQELFTLASQSLTKGRDAQTFGEFFQSVAGDTSVFIEPQALREALAQAGVESSVLPSFVAQEAEAENVGAVEIPVAELVSALAGTGAETALIPNLRIGSMDALTLTEAQENSSKAIDMFQQEAEKAFTKATVDEQFTSELKTLEADYLGQLAAASPYSAQQNQSMATLTAVAYKVMAHRLGRTPLQVRDGYTDAAGVQHKGYRLNIQNDSQKNPGNATFSQEAKYRTVDVFGNDSRVDHYDDRKGLMYSRQKVPSGERWTVFETFPASEGGDQVLGEMFKFHSMEEAVKAVRGLRISSAAKAKNQAKYGDIPNLWKGEEKRVAKALIDAGIGIERFATSSQSKSKYIYLDSGLKVRLADHALPSSYDQADVDYRYGGDVKALVQEVKDAEAKQETDPNILNQSGFVERRAAPRLRTEDLEKPLEEMSIEELQASLIRLRQHTNTNPLTGLPSKAVWDAKQAEGKSKTFVASLDADGLKWFNDAIGHETGGNVLLNRIGAALLDAGIDAYHISGDEFYAMADSQEALDSALKVAQDELSKTVISGNGWNVTGAGFSYGIATNMEEAENGLKQNKAQRQEQGLREERGVTPAGAVRADGATDGSGVAGVGGGAAGNAQGAEFGSNLSEPRRKYNDRTLDLFATEGADGDAQPEEPAVSRDAQPAEPLPRGTFASVTELVQEGTRQLGATSVNSPTEAAQAMAYLGRGAVERFDALITDSKGKPLAIVGAFKGAIAQASVFPATLVGEAFRIPGAANVWFAHNHPSGNATFSDADLNLTKVLTDAFRGSAIEPRGMFAIAGGIDGDRQWVYSDNGNSFVEGDESGTTTAGGKTKTVNVMERIYVKSGALGESIKSPAAARLAAKSLSGGESGLLLLTTQNAPIAFVPVDPAMAEKLRGTGGMDALYKAFSVANPGAAIVVNQNGAYSDDAARNLTGIANSLDIRVIDQMDIAEDGAIASHAEQGYSLSGKTFYQGQKANRAAFNPATLDLTFLANADATSFHHELGHFFLTVYADIASQEGAPAEVVADVNALLKWFDPAMTLDQWQGLSIDQQRPYHEQAAESFEQYLFSGKAPIPELQPLFKRMVKWFSEVYATLKAFVASHPGAQLNSEISAIYDRMLATDAEIEAAMEQRNYQALFREAVEAGMTPEAFAAYQNLAPEMQADAEEALRVRGLRDMKWMRNRRSKVIAELQSEAKEKRQEVMIDARREVMTQPIYRAWQFLTSKIAPEDRISPPPTRKSNPDVVDDSVDSLLTAIGKLGGLDKFEVMGTWGTDPADKPQSGVFGKPVWRVENGLSIDGMAEALGQYGYLNKDESGRVDLAEFELLFAESVRGNPQYSLNVDASAFAEMRPGEMIANPSALMSGKFDRQMLRELGLHSAFIEHLDNLRMVADTGLPPDLVAENFEGFTSGEDLVRQLLAAPSPKDEIENVTDRMMLERYGDLATDKAIEIAADEAIHNDIRTRMVATELNALDASLGSVPVLMKAAKEYARQVVASKSLKTLKPWYFSAEESRNGKKAMEALRKGDREAAAKFKRAELFNHLAAKEAHAGLRELEKAAARLKKIAAYSDKDASAKSRDMEMVNALRAVLSEFGIGSKGEKAAAYLKVVERMTPENTAILRQLIDDTTENAKDFNELSLNEMRELRDQVNGVWEQAKATRNITINGRRMLLTEAQEQVAAKLLESPITSPSGQHQAITADEESKISFSRLLAKVKRVENWVGWKDGQDRFGPLRRLIWMPINDGQNRYAASRQEAFKKVRQLLDPIMADMVVRKIDATQPGEINYTFGAGDAVGMSELLHAILHTGNDSNKQKLLLGRGWAEQNDDGTIDTSRWDKTIARLQKDGVLTKAHYDFAQSMWDYMESLKPGAQIAHKAAFGRFFDEVTFNPVVTPWGTYKGGYMPATPERNADRGADLRSLQEDATTGMITTLPQPQSGFTKGRVEGYNTRLELNLRALTRHVDSVLLFTHMSGPVRDVQRILKGKDVLAAMDATDKSALHHMLLPWLLHASTQTVSYSSGSGFENLRVFKTLRSRTGMTFMMANVMNSMQQVTGFAGAALKANRGHLIHAAVQNVTRPRELAAHVASLSPFMDSRINQEIGVLADQMDDILIAPSKLESAQKWAGRNSYFMQVAIDATMSPMIWLAKYNEVKESGTASNDIELEALERKAVELADNVVRTTQGSQRPIDIAAFEAGSPFYRMFTQFAGWASTMANTMAEEVIIAKGLPSKSAMAKRVAVVALLGYVTVGLTSALIATAFRGGPDDGDDDGDIDLADWLLAVLFDGLIKYPIGMIPVGGAVIQSLIGQLTDKRYDDKISGAPAISALESLGGVVKHGATLVHNAFSDDDKEFKAGQAIRDVGTLIGVGLGLPVAPLTKAAAYGVDVGMGKVQPTGPIDAIRGTITGKASPQSKQ